MAVCFIGVCILINYLFLFRLIHPPRGQLIAVEYRRHIIDKDTEIPEYFIFTIKTLIGEVEIIVPPRNIEVLMRGVDCAETVIHPKALMNYLEGKLVYQSAVIYTSNSEAYKHWKDALKI